MAEMDKKLKNKLGRGTYGLKQISFSPMFAISYVDDAVMAVTFLALILECDTT